MAITREQLEQAIKNLNAKTVDPSLSSAEQAQARADLTKLAVEWRKLGSAPATQPLTEAASPERTNYLADRMKIGFTDFLYRATPESARPYLFDYDFEPTRNFAETERIGREAVERKAQEWFGAGAVRAPSDNLERYAGVALESITSDPIMSVLGGRGVLGVGLNLATSGVSGVTGSIAYDAVAETAESLGATPTWQRASGELAAALAGTAAGAGLGFKSAAFSSVSEARRILRENRDIQKNLDTASDYLVSSGMRQVVDDIVAADPNIDANIETIRNVSRLVPNLKIGPGIVLYDNAVIRKNMETLLKESPQFRASVQQSLKDFGNAIKIRQEALFGTAKDSDVVRSVTQAVGNYGVNLAAAQRRIDNIDAAMDSLISKVRTSTEAIDVGAATTRLMEQKEKALRQKNSVQYEYLLDKHTDAGVTFPADSVQRLHEFVGGATAERLFTPFPTLIGKMRQYLSPKTSEKPAVTPSVMGLLTGRQTAATPAQTTQQYQPITLRQLDSLKQELNKAIRQAEAPNSNLGNTLPSLRLLKDKLREEITGIPEFGKAYTAVDESFYRDLGIPFDTAGLSQLDSLKFNEQVGTYLSKPERASAFLSFVGEKGIPVVKDSILLRMRNKVFSTDGTFKPDAYAKFLAENKAVINTVPGYMAELIDIRNTISKMDAVKGRLDAQAREADVQQADNFLKAVTNNGLNSAINDMLNKPEKLVNYTNNLKNLKPESASQVRNGIRTALLNRAFDSREGAAAFIEQHPNVFDAFFGTPYRANIKALADAYDILRRIDPSRMSFAFSYKEADALQKSTGSSIPQVSSVLRDRITSLTQKAIILLSRWFTKRTAAKRDEEMINLLSSTEALDRIASTARAYRANQINKDQFLERLNSQILAASFRATEMSERGARVEQRTPETMQ
jgi:hypothetical protein